MLTLARSTVLALALCAWPLAAQAQISDNTVKIGILNDQSGLYADFGGKWSYEAAKMAAEDFGGKVLNMPVELVTADHQNKPDVASTIARQWYDVDKVDAIMELTTSSVALAIQQLTKEKKKIWSNRAAIRGSSSPPTMRSAIRSRPRPPATCSRRAARCSARCAIP
jgi:branched-chain amino acid transport system substrate-binding protein